MSTTTKEKETLKKEKSNFENEISTLKKVISDYKAERKLDWKSFKNKINDDIDKIEKSVDKLKIPKN